MTPEAVVAVANLLVVIAMGIYTHRARKGENARNAATNQAARERHQQMEILRRLEAKHDAMRGVVSDLISRIAVAESRLGGHDVELKRLNESDSHNRRFRTR